MPQVEVCLSPELIHQYSPEGKVVVVTDILRATSSMITALANGIKKIAPVATVEECLDYGRNGYLTAGERNGQKIEEFDLGNSPLSYLEDRYAGRDLAITTTNGTRAINLSKSADTILVGAFLNLSTVVDHLLSNQQDVLVFCAGWKGKVSFEDSLFAGALAQKIANAYHTNDDATRFSESLYDKYKDNLLLGIQQSSHYHRLQKLNIEDDFAFCASKDKYDLLPVLRRDHLVLL